MKNKKIAIIILIVGILFILAAAILMFRIKPTKKEYKEIVWNGVYGTPIPSEYGKLEETEYTTYTFNLDTHESKKSFEVNLPKQLELEMIDTNVINYRIENINFVITKTNTNSLKEETEKVKENNEPIYENIHIESAEYDKDLFAIILETAKYNGDKTQMFFSQEVNIYLRAEDSEFAVINIKAHDKRIDKKVIADIMNSIVVKNNKKDFCDKNKCEKNLIEIHESLKKNVSLGFNKDKYVLQYNEGLPGTNAFFVTKTYNETDNSDDNAYKKYTGINVKVVYNKDPNYLTNLPNQEEVKINNKKILRVNEKEIIDEEHTNYIGSYIYREDNIIVIISINSRLDNVEEVAKDFLNINIK